MGAEEEVEEVAEEVEAPQLHPVYLHLVPGHQEVEDHQEAVEDHLSLRQERQEQRLALQAIN